jgi:hypothetical protein
MTTLKAGGLDFSDIGAKRYGHGSAQNVAGATVQPLMPQFRNSEHYYGKRYVGVVKKYCGTATFFLQPLMPQFRYSELYYGKRYKNTQLSQFAHAGKP